MAALVAPPQPCTVALREPHGRWKYEQDQALQHRPPAESLSVQSLHGFPASRQHKFCRCFTPQSWGADWGVYYILHLTFNNPHKDRSNFSFLLNRVGLAITIAFWLSWDKHLPDLCWRRDRPWLEKEEHTALFPRGRTSFLKSHPQTTLSQTKCKDTRPKPGQHTEEPSCPLFKHYEPDVDTNRWTPFCKMQENTEQPPLQLITLRALIWDIPEQEQVWQQLMRAAESFIDSASAINQMLNATWVTIPRQKNKQRW